MHLSFTDAEYRKMTPTQRRRVLKAASVVLTSPPNGEVRELDAQILAYEVKYGISSEEMRRRLTEGIEKETWDVCQWLLLAGFREDLAKRTP